VYKACTSGSSTCPTDVVLVQVKTRDYPSAVEMKIIRNFVCPPLL